MKYPTFEDWLNHLKEINPHLQWDSMNDHYIQELRETYEDSISGESTSKT